MCLEAVLAAESTGSLGAGPAPGTWDTAAWQASGTCRQAHSHQQPALEQHLSSTISADLWQGRSISAGPSGLSSTLGMSLDHPLPSLMAHRVQHQACNLLKPR